MPPYLVNAFSHNKIEIETTENETDIGPDAVVKRPFAYDKANKLAKR